MSIAPSPILATVRPRVTPGIVDSTRNRLPDRLPLATPGAVVCAATIIRSAIDPWVTKVF